MTKKSYFLSADFQANPTDISWQKVAFFSQSKLCTTFLSWTAFNVSCEVFELDLKKKLKSFENKYPNINQGDVLWTTYFFQQNFLENKIWKAALELEKILGGCCFSKVIPLEIKLIGMNQQLF